MKIDHKRWALAIYKWHSVNLVPLAAVSATMFDDHQYGCSVTLTVLGVVVRFGVPASAPRTAWVTPVLGPLWSRRRRAWYWPGDAESSVNLG